MAFNGDESVCASADYCSLLTFLYPNEKYCSAIGLYWKTVLVVEMIISLRLLKRLNFWSDYKIAGLI